MLQLEKSICGWDDFSIRTMISLRKCFSGGAQCEKMRKHVDRQSGMSKGAELFAWGGSSTIMGLEFRLVMEDLGAFDVQRWQPTCSFHEGIALCHRTESEVQSGSKVEKIGGGQKEGEEKERYQVKGAPVISI